MQMYKETNKEPKKNFGGTYDERVTVIGRPNN